MGTDHSLIERWRECHLESPPHLFPDDKLETIKRIAKVYTGFDEYIASPEFGAAFDKSLHVGLLPIPFIGNLANASIFILMLNPGLSPIDYYAERHNVAYRQAHIRNLQQQNANDEYPFTFLDPRFAWHSGFGYWQKKLHSITEELAKQRGIKYQQALSQLARRLACLELLPYHSKAFGADAFLNRLPSVQAMRKYVHETLLPQAQTGKALLIATRSVNNWQLPTHENIITYESTETRSAPLTLTSRGGKAIAKHLGLSFTVTSA